MKDPNMYSVYRKALALAVAIDIASSRILNRRHPGLSKQLREAANSISTNIAEGCGHSSQREFARFLQLALASCAEVAHHLRFARAVKAIPHGTVDRLEADNEETRRMLASLLRKVRDELTDDDMDNSIEAMQRRRAVPAKKKESQTNALPKQNEPRTNAARNDDQLG